MVWFWRLVLTRDWLPAEMRAKAAFKLGQLKHPGAVSTLMLARHEKIPAIAETAVAAMRAIGSAAVEPLLKRLNSPDPNERANVAEALGWLGKDAKPAVASLRSRLSDPQTLVRIRAAEALGQIGPASAESIPEFMAWLSDREPRLVEAAARALGGVGPLAKDALPALVEQNAHRDKNAREAVAEALGKTGGKQVAQISLKC